MSYERYDFNISKQSPSVLSLSSINGTSYIDLYRYNYIVFHIMNFVPKTINASF